jgi:hypothetical protein
MESSISGMRRRARIAILSWTVVCGRTELRG